MRTPLARRDGQFRTIFENHITIVRNAAKEVKTLFVDLSALHESVESIIAREREGDRLKREAVELLDSTSFSRLDPEDIDPLIDELDKILNTMREAVSLMEDYGITATRREATELTSLLYEMACVLYDAIKGALPAPFLKKTRDAHTRISALEERGDAILRDARRNLRAENNVWMFMVWSDVFKELETSTDHAKHALGILLSIARKNPR
ncbi:MAG: DUF47 family protein [Parcubacteria group bacterium]|nr:DUF47 family protein [Parcubacteria group bacterium]